MLCSLASQIPRSVISPLIKRRGVMSTRCIKCNAGVVGDDSVRHTGARQLPGCQLGALIARPGFVYPNVDGQAAIVRGVDWRHGDP
jgi:hypothetical protein